MTKPVVRKQKDKRNRARCMSCGDTIESLSRHDFVRCKCGRIAVDGGNSYRRLVYVDPSDIAVVHDNDKTTLLSDMGA